MRNIFHVASNPRNVRPFQRPIGFPVNRLMKSRMSLIPKIMSHWWETLEQPHRLLDQHYAMGLNPEQFFAPPVYNRFPFRNHPLGYYRPWADLLRAEESGFSIVKNDKDKFHVALDVQHFKPEEVNVKIVDNFIVVEGKHEEKQDDHGIVSRNFMRKYLVPEQCDPEQATSTLSSDGVLTITAPRKPESIADKPEKILKIEHTGKPALENETESQKVKRAQ